jgi:hypothetical protein
VDRTDPRAFCFDPCDSRVAKERLLFTEHTDVIDEGRNFTVMIYGDVKGDFYSLVIALALANEQELVRARDL